MATIKIRLLAAAVLAGALTACGGGGDSAPASTPAPTAAIDKFVGTWASCHPEGGGSSRETLTITRTSDTTANVAFSFNDYAQPGCTGAVTGSGSGTGTVTQVGTKAVGSETVDKIVVALGSETEKQIAVIRSDGRFYSGVPADEPGASIDAEGFPNTIDVGDPLTRQ